MDAYFLTRLAIIGAVAAWAFASGRRQVKRDGYPVGVAGWLLLLGALLVVSPLLFVSAVPPYLHLLERLPEGGFRTFIMVAIGAIVGITLYSIAVAVVFFLKSRRAPKLVIGLYVVSVLFQIFSVAGISYFFGESAFDMPTIVSIGVSAIGAAAWTAYLLKSKRVANTFTR